MMVPDVKFWFLGRFANGEEIVVFVGQILLKHKSWALDNTGATLSVPCRARRSSRFQIASLFFGFDLLLYTMYYVLCIL